MFSKKERMSREEFTRVFKKGKRVHSPLFQVVELPVRIGAERAKYAVVVSKKVARSAVGRNLLRRRLYAALRTLPKDNISRIVIAKKGASERSYNELQKELEVLVGRGSVSR